MYQTKSLSGTILLLTVGKSRWPEKSGGRWQVYCEIALSIQPCSPLQQLHTGRGGISIPYRFQWHFLPYHLLPMLFESKQTAFHFGYYHSWFTYLLDISLFLYLNLSPAGFVCLHIVLRLKGKGFLRGTTTELRDAIIHRFLLPSLNHPSLSTISSLGNCSTLLNRLHSDLICCGVFRTFSWITFVSSAHSSAGTLEIYIVA